MPITTTLVPLRWSDMDAYGHVNNVQYLRLLEEARITAFAQWFGSGSEEMLQGGVIVARQEIEYLRPLVYRLAPVRIDLRVSQIGGASFEVGYEVRDPQDVGDAVYARAETTLAAFDLATERPRRLPQTERDALRAQLEAPVALRGRR
ncbi:thioesterase family protein [Janibacter sp. UYMM211]|uniref:acyl-CoA thioesterase n=1 Tax=Janibacter TaxID=53457 RepID=UPI0017807CB8|nr:acyl-CoA thioesterase [Janibacter melonis]